MKSLLIYYGWLSSYNSSENSWSNNKVAEALARFDILVFGDGIANVNHGDYSNTCAIIEKIITLNPYCKIFGYVTANQTYANFKAKVDEWNNLAIDGIFFDEAGYDYGVSRLSLNEKLNYVHSQDAANEAFINAWNPEHIYGANNDASYPDSTWNPDDVESNIKSNDWYLLESFAIDSSGAYESKSNWALRGDKVQDLPCNIAACSVIADNDANGLDKMQFIYVSAAMWNLDAVGASDAAYGASSAKGKQWALPECYLNYESSCNVVNSYSDADIYLLYLDGGLLKIDFSDSEEASEIIKY